MFLMRGGTRPANVRAVAWRNRSSTLCCRLGRRQKPSSRLTCPCRWRVAAAGAAWQSGPLLNREGRKPSWPGYVGLQLWGLAAAAGTCRSALTTTTRPYRQALARQTVLAAARGTWMPRDRRTAGSIFAVPKSESRTDVWEVTIKSAPSLAV